MRVNRIQALAQHLRTHRAEATVNAPGSCASCSRLSETASVPRPRERDVVYVVDASERPLREMLGTEGNYLVIGAGKDAAGKHLSSLANAVFVPGAGDVAIESAREFFEGVARAETISPAVLSSLVQGADLQHTLALVGNDLGNPVLLQGRDNVVLAASDDLSIGDPIWDALASGAESAFDFATEREVRTYNAIMRGFDYPAFQRPPLMANRMMLQGFLVRGVGHYLFMPEARRPFRDSDRYVMFFLSQVLELALGSRDAGATNEELAEELMDDVLDGRSGGAASVAARARSLGLELAAQGVVLVFSVDDPNASYTTNPKVTHAVRSIDPHAWVTMHDNALVAVVDEARLTREREGMAALARKLGDLGCRCGVSLPIAGVERMREGHRQALAALSIGHSLHPKGRAFHYEDYATHDLVRQASEHLDVGGWVMPLARRIAEYDLANETDYLETLRCFIATRDFGRVSEDRFVHRNTASYRIRRCEELFGIDFADSALLERLSLSFKIMDVMG